MHLDNPEIVPVDSPDLYLISQLSCPFLSREQSLDDVISEDASVLNELGYTRESVADAVNQVFTRSRSCTGFSIPGFHLEEHEQIFLPPCPTCFAYENVWIPRTLEIVAVPIEQQEAIYGHARASRESFVVGDTRQFAVDRWAFIFSKLHPHLIGAHGFFEGSWPYRLNPRRLIPFLLNAKLL